MEENPDATVDDDIPFTKGVAGPSSDTNPLFFMKRIDAGEEVPSVKDSVTSGTTKRKPTERSTGVLQEKLVGDEIELTPEGL